MQHWRVLRASAFVHLFLWEFTVSVQMLADDLGNPIPAPPLIRQISKDPVLKDVKLIAEPWDLGMYQVKLNIALMFSKMKFCSPLHGLPQID